MEEEEAPSESVKAHRFVPGKRNDTLKNTGHSKYLPIEICENDGVDYDIVEDTGVAMYVGRMKRSKFTDRVLSAGEKLLDGSPGGFFLEMQDHCQTSLQLGHRD